MDKSPSASEMTKGLPRKCFVGDSLFAIESEAIFENNWICVARAEDFAPTPNGAEAFRTIEMGTHNLLIVRKSDGSYAGFHNLCRHRGTRLVDDCHGEIRNSCVSCPYHAWTYDLDGRLIGAPNMAEVTNFDRTEHGLLGIGCVNWCGYILVNLKKDSLDFENDFAPLTTRLKNWEIEKLVLAHTLEYEVNANWKLLFQNYSECYHCPTVHPNLNRLTPYKSATNDLTEGPILGGPMQLADGIETVSLDGRKIASPIETLDETQQRSVYYYTIFPNMFVSAHPDYVMVHQITPISNSESNVKCQFLVTPGTTAEDLKRAVNQWNEVNQQDWYVCELTQKGVQSPAYEPGPYSNLESMLAAFDRHYLFQIGNQLQIGAK